MARNYKFFFDKDGSPKARGPTSEKILMNFLETDVQGSDYVCRDLMSDLTAIEDEADDSREFIGNAHIVNLTLQGVALTLNVADDVVDDSTSETYVVPLKRFREVLEDWEAFILDDQMDDALSDEDYL